METQLTLVHRMIDRALRHGLFSALLIVGGDATTRHTMMGACVARFPRAEQIRIDPDPKQPTSISAERVRDARSRTARTTFDGAARLVLCEQADLLTVQASNALLKHIEEPPPGTLWLLSGVSEEAFVPTMVSRCQIIRLPATPREAFSSDREERYTAWLSSLVAPMWIRLTAHGEESGDDLDLEEQELFVQRALRECLGQGVVIKGVVNAVERIREVRASHALSLSRWSYDRIAFTDLRIEP